MVMTKENNRYQKEEIPETKLTKKQKTRTVSLRMLIMVLVDLLGICLLTAMKNNGEMEFYFYQNLLIPFTVIFGVLLAGATVFQVLVIAKKVDTQRFVVTPAMLICVFAFCFVACLFYKYLIPMTIVIASVVGTALFIVYCLYMHIFYR